MLNGVTEKTPSRILFGSGFFFKGVTYNEKVAPTMAEMKAKAIGATQEGGTVNITTERLMPELDNVLVPMKEFIKPLGGSANMEVSFAELSAAAVNAAVHGNLGDSTDGKYDVITSSSIIREGHILNGFGFCGELWDGRNLIIIFKNALCTSGLNLENKSKTNTLFKGTFECYSDLEYGTTKLPYAIFIHKEEDWEAVDPDAVAVPAA